jgi:predicted phage terminase large subunit-like protein
MEYENESVIIPPYSDSQLQEILVECIRSTKFFCKTFFPDVFHAPFSTLHDKIFDLIDAPDRKVVIAAPRGIGKTSIAIALCAKNLLFRISNFIVYVSNSSSSAEQQTENLKFELNANEFVKKVFGPLKTKSAEGIDESFSKRAWVSSYGALVHPRGSGQQVRGMLYHSRRPDTIIIDDLEDTETVSNEEQRFKRKNWFHSDLEKCVSRLDKNYKIVYIDTLKHEDALLQDLLDSSDWASVRLEICDDDYNPTAPDFMSKTEIMAEVNSHREKGMLDVFYREYRNIPISKEDAVFMPNQFKHYDEPDLMSPKIGSVPYLINVVICDPAKTVKVHSAESAIVCWGIDRTSKRMYFRDCVAEKMYPDELINQALLMVKRFNAMLLGVEVTSLEQFIVQPFKNEMLQKGIHPHFLELKATGKKEERVATLAPHYRHGYVYHNRAICGKLETQLMGFPKSKRWDVMDAAAYISKIMEIEGQYFDPVDIELTEDEFKELDNEKPLKYKRAM